MIGVTRGLATLAGAAVAGVLIWFATQVGAETSGAYWATYGLIAAAGLAMALSQIFGGWTKWGWPRFSIGVFLLGFLPVLAAGGWVLLARQPGDWMNTSNWSRDAGIDGLVDDLGNILPAIAFGIGLAFGLSFDTSGPRRTVVERREGVVEEDLRRDADAPLTADRRRYPEHADDRVVTTDDRVATSDDRVRTSDDRVVTSDDRVVTSDDRVGRASDDDRVSTTSDGEVVTTPRERGRRVEH